MLNILTMLTVTPSMDEAMASAMPTRTCGSEANLFADVAFGRITVIRPSNIVDGVVGDRKREVVGVAEGLLVLVVVVGSGD